jgi:hypothetical protein
MEVTRKKCHGADEVSMKNIKYWAALALIFTSVTLAAISPLARAANQNLIQNADLSVIDPSTQQPSGWQPDSWGTNTASFSYNAASPAYVRVDVQNYSDGDAKWRFDAVKVTPGDTYQYSDSYLSSAASNVWAQYLDSSGAATYAWLGSDAASSAFNAASFKFTVPSGIVSASIFHVIDSGRSAMPAIPNQRYL